MAFAAAGEDGKILTLYQLYVRPAIRAHGIGGMLLDEILNSFPEAETCRLEVEEGNAERWRSTRPMASSMRGARKIAVAGSREFRRW